MIARTFHPLTLLLAVSCIQWVVVAELGGFTVLVPYLALAIVAVYACSGPRKWTAIFAYMKRNVSWMLPLGVYLLMLVPILWSSVAQNQAPRQIFYLLGGIGVAACIMTTPKVGKIFRLGAALGLLVFVVCVEILARRIGLSWTDAIREFFGSGNLHWIIYSFFTPIFNYVDPTNPDQFDPSTKNSVADCVLVLALLFRSGSAKPDRDVVGMAFMGAAIGLLIVLNDRSVLIATGASLLLATSLAAFRAQSNNVPLLALKIVAIVGLLVVAIGAALTSSELFGTLSDRFSFEDKSTEGRLEQYQAAIGRIAQHPFSGGGYFEINGHPVHNAFLGAWTYGGIVAFGLVLFFYAALLVRWGAFLTSAVKHQNRWILPLSIEWIAPLPILPLFRMWLSGEGGVFKFGEWIAISAFFGLCAANAIRRRIVARSLLRRMGVSSQGAFETSGPSRGVAGGLAPERLQGSFS